MPVLHRIHSNLQSRLVFIADRRPVRLKGYDVVKARFELELHSQHEGG
jgi:hypothetical protein